MTSASARTASSGRMGSSATPPRRNRARINWRRRHPRSPPRPLLGMPIRLSSLSSPPRARAACACTRPTWGGACCRFMLWPGPYIRVARRRRPADTPPPRSFWEAPTPSPHPAGRLALPSPARAGVSDSSSQKPRPARPQRQASKASAASPACAAGENLATSRSGAPGPPGRPVTPPPAAWVRRATAILAAPRRRRSTGSRRTRCRTPSRAAPAAGALASTSRLVPCCGR